MATVESYTTATGKRRYRVRYRTPDHRQTDKRGFTTKRDAEAFAATVEVEKLRGEYVAPTLGRITVGELAGEWLRRKEADVAPSNYRTLDSAWRVHVESRWGHRRIASIDLAEVEGWIGDMRRSGSSPTIVIRAHGVLAGILDDAVKSRRLVANPARGVENLPKRRRKKHVYLEAGDVIRLAAECGEHRCLVLTLSLCGLRWGEAVALRVRDVEFLRRRLNISSNAVQLGVEHVVGPTKSGKPRSVPVPQFVLDELAEQCRGKGRDDLVFPGADGGFLPRPKSGRGWFAAAVRRAGVQPITPHDLRHTAASLAVSAGANVLALARMLGHEDPSVTLGVYGDLFDSDLDALADTLDQRYSPRGVGKMWANGIPPTTP